MKRFESCKNLSSKKLEFFLTLENILDYLVSNKIDGEIVECGVFKGANCRFICDYLKTNGFEEAISRSQMNLEQIIGRISLQAMWDRDIANEQIMELAQALGLLPSEQST